MIRLLPCSTPTDTLFPYTTLFRPDPALRLGPPWWFHDSPEGMRRFRERATETAGFYNTVGFNDDTRAFLSIPARHDLARRKDCAWLPRLVGAPTKIGRTSCWEGGCHNMSISMLSVSLQKKIERDTNGH